MRLPAHQWTADLRGYRCHAGLRLPEFPECDRVLPRFLRGGAFSLSVPYFGQACRPDRLRSACTVTVPLNTDLSQLTSTVSQEEHQLTKAYQFSGYTVGTEQLSTDAIKTLLTSSPREAGISSGTYSASLLSQISEAPAVQNTASLLQSVPPVAYLLAVLLVALIIMELVLAARRKRRKKRKRKK